MALYTVYPFKCMHFEPYLTGHFIWWYVTLKAHTPSYSPLIKCAGLRTGHKQGCMYWALAVTRLGLWRLMYHSWHKLHFYKKIKCCKMFFLISVTLRWHIGIKNHEIRTISARTSLLGQVVDWQKLPHTIAGSQLIHGLLNRSPWLIQQKSNKGCCVIYLPA